MVDTTLQTDDLAALGKTLKGLNRTLAKVTPRSLARFAAEVKLAADLRGRSLGGVFAHAVKGGAFLVFSRRGGSGIGLNTARVPTAAGSEFGAKAWPQFDKWKGNRFSDLLTSNVGYMLHPAMRQLLPKATGQIADEVHEAIATEVGAT